MKGVIVSCLREMVIAKFSKEKWMEILVASGQKPEMSVFSNVDIDDALVMKLVGQTCKTLNLSLPQAADAFGDYWVNDFAVRIYKVYYSGSKSAKEFLLKIDQIHTQVTRTIENAKPPKFIYEWKADNTLIITYHSTRSLIDFVAGLAKGVGRYFNEKLEVKKMGINKVEIIFSGEKLK